VSPACDRLRHLSALLAAAREAERIAADVAAAQARLAPDASLQRALRQQARQELLHAGVFTAALACLPRADPPPRLDATLAAFRRQLKADVQAGRLAASMFGLQHVLEALGHLALQPPPGELAGLGDRYLPLRRLLAQHETAHKRLGELWVPRLAAGLPAGDRQQLLESGGGYLALARRCVEAGLEACAPFEADRHHYAHATAACLDRLTASLRHACDAGLVRELQARSR
jgi:hypothetical protein